MYEDSRAKDPNILKYIPTTCHIHHSKVPNTIYVYVSLTYAITHSPLVKLCSMDFADRTWVVSRHEVLIYC